MDILNIFKWCPGAESNHRHEDFQSTALPTELPGQEKGLQREGRVLNPRASHASSNLTLHRFYAETTLSSPSN